jgi:hypothetical protein
MKNIAWKKEWTGLIAIVVGLRILYAMMGFLVTQLGLTGVLGELTYQVMAPYLRTEPFFHYFINPWFQWDTLSYMEISILGYNPASSSIAYMPLYPTLMRFVAPLTLGDHLFAGLLISTLFFVLALILFYEIVSEIYKPDVAWRSVIALAVFPTSFFLLAGYTEALFLSLVLGCYYLACRRHWYWAAILGSLATLTRLQGVILTPVLLWMMLINLIQIPEKHPWQQIRQVGAFLKRSFKDRSFAFLYRFEWLALFMPVLTFAVYQTWMKLTGFASIDSALNTYWKIQTVLPWEGFFLFVQRLFTMKLIYMDWIDLIIFTIVIGASLIGLRILDPGLSLYVWLTIAILFMRGTPPHLLASFSRYFLALFPVFVIFGLLRGRPIRFFALVVSFSLQLMLAWVFLIGSWVA